MLGYELRQLLVCKLAEGLWPAASSYKVIKAVKHPHNSKLSSATVEMFYFSSIQKAPDFWCFLVTHCVILGQSLDLSEPFFLYL